MEIKTLLMGKHDCACGRDHTCDVRFVELGENVLRRLEEICRDFSRIHIVQNGLSGSQGYIMLGADTAEQNTHI